jgi:hypothetical protein
VGSARALFDEDATPCAPSVLSANRKLGALWLGLCIIAGSLIEQSGQMMDLLGSDPVKLLQSRIFGKLPMAANPVDLKSLKTPFPGNRVNALHPI